MNGEVGNGKIEEDFDDDVESTDDTEDMLMSDDLDDDNIGDISVEINVEELVARLENGDAAEHRKAIRRRLEEIAEQRREAQELDSTYNFNLDDDI